MGMSLEKYGILLLLNINTFITRNFMHNKTAMIDYTKECFDYT